MRPAKSFVAALLVCVAALVPAAALAQQRPPQTPAKPAPIPPAKPKKPKKPRPPIFLALGASGQVTGNTFTETLSFTQYGEPATVTGPMTLGRMPHVDVGFGVQMAKRVSLGGRASFFQGTGHTDASFSIPNPLIFNANRTASGGGPAHRSSLDIDIELAITLVAKKAWRVELMIGPTVSRLNQQLATDSLTYAETYPYDTIILQPSGSSAGQSSFGFGGQVGMRVTRQLKKRTGFTMDVRWRYAIFSPQVEATAQRLISTGVQVGGGLKFVF